MKLIKYSLIAAILITAGTATEISTAKNAHAEAGGCLKYGAAGAVGGHFVGHHTILGAIGGCATGMWVRHKHRKEEKLENNRNAEDAAKWREQQRHYQNQNPSYRPNTNTYPVQSTTSSGF